MKHTRTKQEKYGKNLGIFGISQKKIKKTKTLPYKKALSKCPREIWKTITILLNPSQTRLKEKIQTN